MRENQRGANGFLDNPKLEGVLFLLIFNAEVLHIIMSIAKELPKMGLTLSKSFMYFSLRLFPSD